METPQTDMTNTPPAPVMPATPAAPQVDPLQTVGATPVPTLAPESQINASAMMEAPVTEVLGEDRKLLKEIRHKFETAQEFIKHLLKTRRVKPPLGQGAEIPLPVDKVEFLTGINDQQQPTFDLQVKLSDLQYVGEQQVVANALDVLKHIPVLDKTFNFDPASTDTTRPKPVAFSWGPEDKIVIKFAFPDKTDPALVVDDILTMRKGLIAAQAATEHMGEMSVQPAEPMAAPADAALPMVGPAGPGGIMAEPAAKPEVGPFTAAVNEERDAAAMAPRTIN